MRENQIKIDPFEFTALYALEISREVNAHAKASIIMQIKDDCEEKYTEMMSRETWVKIIGIGREDSEESDIYSVLFYGFITDFLFSHDGYETILKLELVSGSALMDFASHFRVFQNDGSICTQIHTQLIGAYQEGRVICMEGSEDKTRGVLIQYQETDWEFLKRIASRAGRYLVPDALRRGVKYTIGLPRGIERVVQTNSFKIKLEMGEYMEKFGNGMTSLRISDMLELVLTGREIYQIGDSIFYKGRPYFIYRIFTEYSQEECIHTYYLRTKEALRPFPIQHVGITGCSFDAIVTDVKKDKVQVEIDKDEWKGSDGKKWFLYSTVYSSYDGTGWYCMPEVGDSVRLYIPDREENSFIISAVHKETDSSRQNPDYKSLKTKYGKEILFTPDSILMTNNQGMMVEMNDKNGITISSDKDIVIEADENLTVSSVNASLLIAADDVLQVKQGSTTMTLRGDISFTGGEFRIQ